MSGFSRDMQVVLVDLVSCGTETASRNACYRPEKEAGRPATAPLTGVTGLCYSSFFSFFLLLFFCGVDRIGVMISPFVNYVEITILACDQKQDLIPSHIGELALVC
ncbi:hypothetical protein EJ02DRAFT_125592 [Clathrospora elynae]|uniref:Uncharacterized protein n=1 Tax=Clathrospora elynae TaxID=706981 RepID=A0A6A5STZ5_9PLEO|nr:hypothetical protein EJ02DRAFT_125592 [Clathrospora elynae]